MEFIRAIHWDDPTIVAAFIGVFGLVIVGIAPKLWKRRKHSDGAQADGSPTVSTQIAVGLDKQGVGEEVSKAVEPLSRDFEFLKSEIKSLRDQLATAQLAAKQPVPDSGDPLKVKAVQFYNAGVDAQDRGEDGQAIGHYLDALKLNPDNATAHYNVGVALAAKDDRDGAIEHWTEALRIDPYNATVHNNLGIALLVKGDLDGAIEHWTEALRIDPYNATVHINLGSANETKGDLDGAIEHWTEALRIDPYHATIHTSLGDVLKAKGDLDGAIEHWNEALRIDRDNPDAHISLGNMLAFKGDLDGAIEHWTEVLRIYPDNAITHNYIGKAMARNKATTKAVAALTKAIELDKRFREKAEADKDFDPIRDDPAFRKLVYGE